MNFKNELYVKSVNLCQTDIALANIWYVFLTDITDKKRKLRNDELYFSNIPVLFVWNGNTVSF